MSTITLNGTLCHRAELLVPWSGRWVLKVYLDGAVPSGRVAVQWGTTTFSGTVDPDASGAWGGETVVTIVGGAGWATAPKGQWLQNDAGLPASSVALSLAQAVGETITPIGNPYRQIKTAYSRANVPASAILRDLLAPGAAWWVGFDGATFTGARSSPACAAEVLDYDPETRIATLEAEQPGDLPIGAVLAADPPRRPFEALIAELRVNASGDEQVYEARLEAAADPSRARIAALLEQLTGPPAPAPHATLRQAQVASQGPDGRVSVRYADREGELPDSLPVYAWCGTPGVSATVIAGTSTWIGFDAADPSKPFCGLWSPRGTPGHVPTRVRHEASAAIEMVNNSTGKVLVGPPGIGEAAREPVCKAPTTVSYLVALESYLQFIDTVVIRPLVLLTGDPGLITTYNTLVINRQTAAGNPLVPGDVGKLVNLIPTTRLEAR